MAGVTMPPPHSLTLYIIFSPEPALPTFVLVVDIEEDDAVFRHSLAILTGFLEPAVGLATELAPVVNQPVIPATDIFLEFPPVGSVHLAVGISRIGEDTVDYSYDPFITARIVLFYPGQLLAEMNGGSEKI